MFSTKAPQAIQPWQPKGCGLSRGVPVVPPAAEIPQIASAIMTRALLPAKAHVDALHIAAVAHHRIKGSTGNFVGQEPRRGCCCHVAGLWKQAMEWLPMRCGLAVTGGRVAR
ncbi:MAG: hypothetical protein ACK6CT_12980 [Planctomycetia bacterium]